MMIVIPTRAGRDAVNKTGADTVRIGFCPARLFLHRVPPTGNWGSLFSIRPQEEDKLSKLSMDAFLLCITWIHEGSLFLTFRLSCTVRQHIFTGHIAQRGVRATQIVAPKSIIA